MKIDALKWGGVLLLVPALMASSAWVAWAWQANAYGKQLAIQDTAHQTTLTNLANANSTLILAEQGKRYALEQELAATDQTHYRALTDAKPLKPVCVIVLLLLICGCQSNSTPPPQVVVTACPPPPGPAAWFMEPQEPNLTERMLNELSESPATATKD